MKLATFAEGGMARVGLVSPDETGLLDLRAAAGSEAKAPALASMMALIEAGEEGLALVDQIAAAALNDWRPLAEVRLLAPLPEPRQLRDFAGFTRHLIDGPWGLQRVHARENREPEPPRPNDVAEILREHPLFYFGNRLNVVGPDAQIPWPRDARLLDFEVEVGAVIGRTGKDISREDADTHIFGYTIFNDVSARDVQGRQTPGGLGPCKAKSFDAGNVLGPWIVTRDELASPYGGTARVRVNGETWAEESIDGILHDFAEMIEFASRDETIHAGEVFGSGTVSGCCGLELDRWIQPGDVVELEVSGIGVLRNCYGDA